MSDKKMDMLNGSLWDKILIFAIPLALTGILQQVFNATDVAIVGQYVGKHAMAAVGCNAPVVALVVNLFMGVAIGVNVTIAGFIGINDKEGIGRAVHTACITVVLLSIAVAGAAIALAPWILNLLAVPLLGAFQSCAGKAGFLPLHSLNVHRVTYQHYILITSIRGSSAKCFSYFCAGATRGESPRGSGPERQLGGTFKHTFYNG